MGSTLPDPIVAIVSGGLDSVTMLHQLKTLYENIHVLTFRYGQKHTKEIQSAKYFTKFLGVEKHTIINLTSLKDIFGQSALTSKKKVPHLKRIEDKTPEILKQTVVPFRNGIFLSVAVAYASSRDIEQIYYGAHASDFAVYPDCRPAFVDNFQLAAQFGTEKAIKLTGFFINKKKSDIVKIGYTFGVDFAKTWSCYEGLQYHCGKCPSCSERKNAFAEAGINDVTKYSS